MIYLLEPTDISCIITEHGIAEQYPIIKLYNNA